MADMNIRALDNGDIETVIKKNDTEIVLNDEETKELWRSLSYAESYDFKIPF